MLRSRSRWRPRPRAELLKGVWTPPLSCWALIGNSTQCKSLANSHGTHMPPNTVHLPLNATCSPVEYLVSSPAINSRLWGFTSPRVILNRSSGVSATFFKVFVLGPRSPKTGFQAFPQHAQVTGNYISTPDLLQALETTCCRNPPPSNFLNAATRVLLKLARSDHCLKPYNFPPFHSVKPSPYKDLQSCAWLALHPHYLSLFF